MRKSRKLLATILVALICQLVGCNEKATTLKDPDGWVYHTDNGGKTTWHKIDDSCIVYDKCPADSTAN